MNAEKAFHKFGVRQDSLPVFLEENGGNDAGVAAAAVLLRVRFFVSHLHCTAGVCVPRPRVHRFLVLDKI